MTGVRIDTAARLRAHPNLKTLLNIHCIYNYFALACDFKQSVNDLEIFRDDTYSAISFFQNFP